MRLLGFLQGVLVTMVLILRPRPSAPRRILALFLLALTAYLGVLQLDALYAKGTCGTVLGLRLALPFLFGPFLYLYIAAASGRWLRFSVSSALHLTPFLAMVTVAPWVHFAGDRLTMLELIHAVHGLGYTVGAARVLHDYTSRVARLGVQTESRDRLLWLRSLVGSNGVTGLIAMCSHAAGSSDWGTTLRVACLIHCIGAGLLVYPRAVRDTARYPRVSFGWKFRRQKSAQ
ncbi:MAG TPA: hypothetical protein VHO25_14760 [Polyangiaceae bacterium]|nr:hypothetical protein [Polyangiaceae bacterium]